VQKDLESLQAKEPGKSVSFTTVCLSVLLQKAKKNSSSMTVAGWREPASNDKGCRVQAPLHDAGGEEDALLFMCVE
jgi:hypothetical protein